MTPEEVEARFQRIESLLENTAQRVDDNAENLSILLVSMERLSQSAIDYSRWKVETDQRFNILLEEVRTSNLRIASLEQRT